MMLLRFGVHIGGSPTIHYYEMALRNFCYVLAIELVQIGACEKLRKDRQYGLFPHPGQPFEPENRTEKVYRIVSNDQMLVKIARRSIRSHLQEVHGHPKHGIREHITKLPLPTVLIDLLNFEHDFDGIPLEHLDETNPVAFMAHQIYRQRNS